MKTFPVKMVFEVCLVCLDSVFQAFVQEMEKCVCDVVQDR